MAQTNVQSAPDLPSLRQRSACLVRQQALLPRPAVNAKLPALEVLGPGPPLTRRASGRLQPARSPTAPNEEITILHSDDVIRARQAAREFSRKLGFGVIDQIHVATATCELSRNVYQYAGNGKVTLKPVSRNGAQGMEILVEDQGPGIPERKLTLQDSPGLGKSRGHGLRGTRQLMDEFEIQSQIGVGTTVRIIKWRK